MKIFLVAGGSRSWRDSGYGHSLAAGDATKLLVSFVEFAKDPSASLPVTGIAARYKPSIAAPGEEAQGISPLID